MNLLSLINPSLAHVSTVALMANHGLIRACLVPNKSPTYKLKNKIND